MFILGNFSCGSKATDYNFFHLLFSQKSELREEIETEGAG